jgi:hypothetical protein
MKISDNLALSKPSVNGILIDISALAFIFFSPALAHLVNFPLYMIEPMRVMLILSIVHSTRRNSILLALTLPLFSFAVTSHPVFIKMLIITGELLVNTLLFYLLYGKLRNGFTAMFLAIISSKIVCYLLYLVFFPLAFVIAEANPLFLGIQLLTTLVFSGYLLVAYKTKL